MINNNKKPKQKGGIEQNLELLNSYITNKPQIIVDKLQNCNDKSVINDIDSYLTVINNYIFELYKNLVENNNCDKAKRIFQEYSQYINETVNKLQYFSNNVIPATEQSENPFESTIQDIKSKAASVVTEKASSLLSGLFNKVTNKMQQQPKAQTGGKSKYDKIYDPENNKMVKINSSRGKQIIRSYLEY